jgi:hypothetical protein
MDRGRYPMYSRFFLDLECKDEFWFRRLLLAANLQNGSILADFVYNRNRIKCGRMDICEFIRTEQQRSRVLTTGTITNLEPTTTTNVPRFSLNPADLNQNFFDYTTTDQELGQHLWMDQQHHDDADSCEPAY